MTEQPKSWMDKQLENPEIRKEFDRLMAEELAISKKEKSARQLEIAKRVGLFLTFFIGIIAGNLFYVWMTQ